jgi:hypothetical protein
VRRKSRRVILTLDFDGVLHAADAHFALADVRECSVDELFAAGLFAHRQGLADVLARHPAVESRCTAAGGTSIA